MLMDARPSPVPELGVRMVLLAAYRVPVIAFSIVHDHMSEADPSETGTVIATAAVPDTLMIFPRAESGTVYGELAEVISMIFMVYPCPKSSPSNSLTKTTSASPETRLLAGSPAVRL